MTPDIRYFGKKFLMCALSKTHCFYIYIIICCCLVVDDLGFCVNVMQCAFLVSFLSGV